MTSDVSVTLDIGETLASLREKSKKTVRQIAAEIGRSYPRVIQIEHDGTDSIEMVSKLANAYGANFDVVFRANERTKNK